MLQHLSIRNVALIDRLDLDLPDGLSILTGETGAGKSITFDALALVLGGRASSELVRTGETEATVTALFAVSDRARASVHEALSHAGLEPTDELLIRRTVSRRGANRVYINDQLATASVLPALVGPLVDLLGQHQHLALTRTETHRLLIDAWAGHGDHVRAMQDAWRAWKQAADHLSSLQRAAEARVERIDLLRFQVSELTDLSLRDGEFDELERKLLRARNFEKLRAAFSDASEALTWGVAPATERVATASAQLARAARLDPSFDDLHKRLEEVRVLLDDVARDVQHESRSLDGDDDLDALEARHERLRRACRKYQSDERGLLDRLDAARRELAQLDNWEETLDGALRAEQQNRAQAQVAAEVLHASRVEAAGRLFERALDVLAQLGMPHTRLAIAPLPTDARWTASGFDGVEMLFSANPGEDLAPLRRIASGGELSRLLLALKTTIVASDPIETYVFDEIDTGIGGATAEITGRLLQELARDRQVLCITHLPQIAAFGRRHFHVHKRVEHDRTFSRVRALEDDEREEELARMLGGVDVADVTRAHARDLLRKARSHASP
jgi:DNA repair protein RecN (Recombination protein N)